VAPLRPLSLALAGGLVALTAVWLPAQDPVPATGGVDLYRDTIRPALELHCLDCHGAVRPKGGLDLSTREGLLLGGIDGPSAVPGDPGASYLMTRIRHEGDEDGMPRKADKLPEPLIEAFAEWIRAGAPYEESAAEPGAAELAISQADRAFWSFLPLQRPEPPAHRSAERQAWVRTPIDAFVLEGMTRATLEPAAPASRRTLARRAWFDLLGLPPAPEEIEAFVADESPDAWEKLIDRLLASPHYGERWGRYWLDVARYADSGGYEFDVERPTAWPYRDFVIKAFNEDLPFDRFLALQLAGDEIAPDDPWALAATGFLAAGPTISNQTTEKNRYDELDDMLATTSASMLGLTVGCARCHDHKFDPIPTRDYYRMLAAFTASQRREAPMATMAELAAAAEERAAYDARLAAATAVRDRFVEGLREREYLRTVAALPLSEPERALLSHRSDPERTWRYTFEEPGEGWQERTFDDAAWRTGLGGFGEKDTPNSVVGTRWKTKAMWARKSFEWNGDGADLRLVGYYDDDLEVWINGVQATHTRGYITQYAILPLSEEARAALRPGRNEIAVHCIQDFGGQFWDLRPVTAALVQESGARVAALETPHQKLTEAHAEALQLPDDALRQRVAPDELEQWLDFDTGIAAVKRSEPERFDKVLSITDRSADAGDSWLLERGSPASKKEKVAPGFLRVITPAASFASFSPAPPPEPRTTHRREAFARWITDVDQGAGRVAARVIANRIWQGHFGEGLVRTPSDFGVQGDRPADPALLDWLAAEIVAGGWRLKRIHKLVMTSAVYLQGAPSVDTRTADPDHRRLSGVRPRRLEAEAIRDAMLAVAGTLNPEMGGPGVKPWIHPDAIATGSTQKWPKDVVDGPATWRRSVYLFLRRSVRIPMMEVFDAPDMNESCARRSSTTTAPQALALLNNRFVREQAGHLGRRVEREAGADLGDQVGRLFEVALGRAATRNERAQGIRFVRKQADRYAASAAGDAQALAMTDLSQAVLNLNEFLYVD